MYPGEKKPGSEARLDKADLVTSGLSYASAVLQMCANIVHGLMSLGTFALRSKELMVGQTLPDCGLGVHRK